MNSSERKGSERGALLTDLSQMVSSILVELLGIEKELADHAGQETAIRMAGHWGGQLIYFPHGNFEQSDRDKQIWAEFNGNNHAELARKYKVSIQWIYKIVKAQRQADLARRQGGLF